MNFVVVSSLIQVENVSLRLLKRTALKVLFKCSRFSMAGQGNTVKSKVIVYFKCLCNVFIKFVYLDKTTEC